jgi:hypothetical protein
MTFDEIEKRGDEATMSELGPLVAAVSNHEIGRAVRMLLPSSNDPRMLVQQLVGWLSGAAGLNTGGTE